MFNKSIIVLKKISLFFGVFFVLFSCKEDHSISFIDKSIEKTENAKINISYPKAEGNEKIADRINNTIENFLANEINMSEKSDKNLKLEDAIKDFDNEYKLFKEDFGDSTQEWEALIESEVNYESEAILCVSVTSYLDTGGAHGNSHVTFLNFDRTSGKLLKIKDIINDEEGFKNLVLPFFEKATKPLSDDEEVQNLFFGEAFQLPENIGFNTEGVILLYNVYEIASYVQGVTEFTIPYENAKPFLKIEL
jgi:hypothetical protein